MAAPRGAEPPEPQPDPDSTHTFPPTPHPPPPRSLGGAGSRGRPVPSRRRSPQARRSRRRQHHEPDGDRVPSRPVPVLPGRQGRAGARVRAGPGGSEGFARSLGGSGAAASAPSCLAAERGSSRAGHGESLLRVRAKRRGGGGGCVWGVLLPTTLPAGSTVGPAPVGPALRCCRLRHRRLPRRVSSQSLPRGRWRLGTEPLWPP